MDQLISQQARALPLLMLVIQWAFPCLTTAEPKPILTLYVACCLQWILGKDTEICSMIGVNGQFVLIDPRHDIIIVKLSSYPVRP